MKNINRIIASVLFLYACSKEIKPNVGAGNKVELTTYSVSAITNDSAKCGGNITRDGQEAITERGVCWGLNELPTIADFKTNNGIGGGNFTSVLKNLMPFTVYYVRAYATNVHGTVYGNQVTFRTLAERPTLTTNATSNISYTTATTNATILNNGGSPILQRGFCYSNTTRIPDTLNSRFTRDNGVSDTYSFDLTSLSPNTKYYIRAYAKNSVGLSYSANVDSFTTRAVIPPTVNIICPSSTSVTQTSISLSASVINNGGSIITQTGYNYSTSSTFANAVTYYVNPANSPFPATITGLNPNTTYYIRAFAKNAINPAFGYSANYCTSTTLPVSPPTVINVCGATSVTTNSAIVSGNVTSTGGANLSQVGICYSSTTANPTIGSIGCFTLASSNLSTGLFSVALSGLNYNTTYYYRTYAKNSVNSNVSYGTPSCNFTTNNLPPPTVLNNCSPSAISTTTANVSGSISNDGGAQITASGICYSFNNTNPTIGGLGCQTISAPTLGVGNFSVSITGLISNTTYYYRTYAKNSANTTYAYGTPICSFTTNAITPPIVQNNCTPTSITTNSAVVSGSVISDGGAAISQRGICYSSTSSNPIVGTSTIVSASTLGTGTFSVLLTGLNTGVSYYYRTYAKNNTNANYAYGTPVCMFTTSAPPSVVTNCPVSSISGTSAIVGGVASGSSSGQRGVCYSSTNSMPTISNSVLNIGTGTGSFSSSLTGLSPCTNYNVRAFVINNLNGQPVYGSVCSFTTTSILTSPILTSPNNGASLTSTSSIIWFTWNSVPCATSYKIQISRSSTFSFANTYTLSICGGSQYPVGNSINQAIVNSPTTQFCINSGGSTQNGIWYWRVQAINGLSVGPWSTTRAYNYTW